MFLEDLRIGPAPRAIELRDDDAAVLEEHLEDPVLVRVELQEPAIAAEADGVERIEHAVGREAGVRRRRCGRRVVGHRRMLRAVLAQCRWVVNFGESTTMPAMSSSGGSVGRNVAPPLPFVDEARAAAIAEGRPENSLLPKPSARLSGAKNESWKSVESCHRADRSARRVATVLA